MSLGLLVTRTAPGNPGAVAMNGIHLCHEPNGPRQ
jgi:hypothetical protein